MRKEGLPGYATFDEASEACSVTKELIDDFSFMSVGRSPSSCVLVMLPPGHDVDNMTQTVSAENFLQIAGEPASGFTIEHGRPADPELRFRRTPRDLMVRDVLGLRPPEDSTPSVLIRCREVAHRRCIPKRSSRLSRPLSSSLTSTGLALFPLSSMCAPSTCS